MKKNKHFRFFVGAENIIGGIFVSSDKDLINQVKNVFRLKTGDEISVLDGSGYEYRVLLQKITKGALEGKLLDKKFSQNSEAIKINLYCPLLKGGSFDLVLEKCTELGVFAFYPVAYKNCVVKPKGNKERWEKIVKEASEQCGRYYLPKINNTLSFEEAVSTITKKQNNIVADHEAINKIKDLSFVAKGVDAVNIFVGPEGGFSEKEIDEMQNRDFVFVNISDGILRAETACITSVGIFSNL